MDNFPRARCRPTSTARQVRSKLFFASLSPQRDKYLPHPEELAKQAFRRMAASPCVPILRDARKSAASQDEELQLGVVDRLMAIERARPRRQRIFEPGRAIEQHHAVVL